MCFTRILMRLWAMTNTGTTDCHTIWLASFSAAKNLLQFTFTQNNYEKSVCRYCTRVGCFRHYLCSSRSLQCNNVPFKCYLGPATVVWSLNKKVENKTTKETRHNTGTACYTSYEFHIRRCPYRPSPSPYTSSKRRIWSLFSACCSSSKAHRKFLNVWLSCSATKFCCRRYIWHFRGSTSLHQNLLL